ncbi:MAG: hypothetical protein CMB67_01425 [Euryarchaeota archaeon]|nr:hypothetical protein [Euryarchaeota archaeon]
MEPRISVSTTICPHEDSERVVESVRSIFPEWNPEQIPSSCLFPSDRDVVKISAEVDSLEGLLSIVRENRVLDTALDAMAMDSEEDYAAFSISRQSASVGKISFVLDKWTFGGSIDVILVGSEVRLWLEQHTWHRGREGIPRSIGDDNSMTELGEPSEWFDQNGRRMMGESN